MALHKFGAAQLLAAAYTRLTTSALTSAYTIYNYAVPSATMPYVTLGGMIGGKSPGFTSTDIKGQDIVLHAHVWSNYQGDAEVSAMMDNVVQALTGSDLSISGYTNLIGIADFAQVLVDATDPNNIIRHGVLRFRFQIA